MNIRLSAYAAGAIALALLTPAAIAQDLASPQFSVPTGQDYFAPVDQWSGFYAGVHGGVVEAGRLPNPFGTTKSFTGGVQLGSNLQFGKLVVGAEVEATFSHNYRFDLGAGAGLKRNWSGAVKARVGIAADQFLVFGTMGYGMARLEPDGTVTSAASNVGGLVFGGGVEYALTNQLSVKLEYQQANYSNVAFSAGGASQSQNRVDHAVRAGLNFRF